LAGAGALLLDRGGRAEGRKEIEELTGAGISSILTAECAGTWGISFYYDPLV